MHLTQPVAGPLLDVARVCVRRDGPLVAADEGLHGTDIGQHSPGLQQRGLGGDCCGRADQTGLPRSAAGEWVPVGHPGQPHVSADGPELERACPPL